MEENTDDTNIVTNADGTTEICYNISLPEAQEGVKALEDWEHAGGITSFRPKSSVCSIKLKRSSPLFAGIFGR